MGSDTALCLVTASVAASLTQRMGKAAAAQPRWPRKYSIQCCWVDAAVRYRWWQEREGIDAAHLPAAGASCEPREADPVSERAEGYWWGFNHLKRLVWLVAALYPSISARVVLPTPRECGL